jgi:hypothetical protein
MKKTTIILCLFNLFFSFSQEKESYSFTYNMVKEDKFINKNKDTLKVYLKDAETDKNIADAKVTLEGFEIPEIKGKYHKQGKYYYFTEIPQGYNTIMTYHKKYNEKGFQDTKGLPKELNLKLFTPYRVKLSGDSINCYKEDNTRLIMYMYDSLRVFYKDRYYADSLKICGYFKIKYPELRIKKIVGYYDNINNIIEIEIHKKNKKAFKRFNDPIIYSLEKNYDVLLICGVYLHTVVKTYHGIKTFLNKDGTPNYLNKYIKTNLLGKTPEEYIKLVNEENEGRLNMNKLKYGYPKLKIEKPKIIKKPKQNYNNMHLSFEEQHKKGLIKNGVYTLNKKELDSLYKLERKKYKKGKPYVFKQEQYNDTLFLPNLNSIGMLTAEDININYSLQPNRLRLYYDTRYFNNGTEEIVTNLNLGFNYKILTTYYNGNFYQQNKHYFGKKIIDIIKKKKSIFYKLSNNNASPLGISDMIYHLRENGNDIKQANYFIYNKD